jgi:putative ABC transport system permease protein
MLAPYLQELEVLTKSYETANLELENKKEEVLQQFEKPEQELAIAKAAIEESRAKLASILLPEWYVGDRNWIASYVSYEEDANRIDAIAKVFPAIFFFVAALVCLTTMTRMVDEQRTQIGILKALGYGKFAIAGKFMKYAFFATVLGSILGVLVGQKLFPYVVIDAYRIMYAGLPYILTNYQPHYAIIASIVAIVCTMVATYIACMADLRSEPAQLMRPVSPKAGKRILLERVPLLWKHINFTKKSTLRNLLRYKKRFLMTVIGIAGCMGLIIVGFGLKDSIGVMAELQYQDLWLQDAQISFESLSNETQKKEFLDLLDQDERITKTAFVYSKGGEVTHRGDSKASSLVV